MLALRLPFAAGSGVLVALAVFTLLWRFVNVPMEFQSIETERVNFTRQLVDTPVVDIREPKVERPKPPPWTPPDSGLGGDDVGPPTRFVPTEFAGPTIGDGGGLPVSGSDHDAIPMVRVPPEYPASAVARNIEGWVRVQFSITVAGTVRDATVVRADPPRIFDQAALKAIARWRYNPRVVDGSPVERVGMQTVIRFDLEETR